ncbi:hypothetical protein ABTQ07_20360, partial [Acinetobacter baumannii]
SLLNDPDLVHFVKLTSVRRIGTRLIFQRYLTMSPTLKRLSSFRPPPLLTLSMEASQWLAITARGYWLCGSCSDGFLTTS